MPVIFYAWTSFLFAVVCELLALPFACWQHDFSLLLIPGIVGAVFGVAVGGFIDGVGRRIMGSL